MKKLCRCWLFIVLLSSVKTYAQDANSEQEQFNARIEQLISDSYGNDYTVEKTGNTIRLTSTDYSSHTSLYYASVLAIAPLRAKFLALTVLEMDATEELLHPNRKPATFIKLLIRRAEGAVVGQAAVFRKDYADLVAIHRAQLAALEAVQREAMRWARMMERQ